MASNETHEMKRSIWLARFKEKEDSGLTVDQYCEQIGCNPKTYFYIVRQIAFCRVVRLFEAVFLSESKYVKLFEGDRQII